MQEILAAYMDLGICPSMLMPGSFTDSKEHLRALRMGCRLEQYRALDLYLTDNDEIAREEIRILREQDKIINYNSPAQFQNFGAYNAGSELACERQGALDFAKKHLENLPSKANVPTKLDIYQIRSTGEIVIGKKIASGKYVDLKGGFTRVSDATKYLDENRAHLEALLEEKKKMPPLRSDENAPRIGKEYRPQATVVTPERFLQEFGFRGVQFGNWVEQERRAQDLNNAYDALLDMADIIGLPARALSLEGKLGPTSSL